MPNKFPKHVVALERSVRRRSLNDVYAAQVDYLIQRATAAGRGDTWEVTKGKLKVTKGSGRSTVACTVTFQKVKGKAAVEENQWDTIQTFLMDTGKVTQFGSLPWEVRQVTTVPHGSKLGSKDNAVVKYEDLYPAKIEEKEFDYGDLIIASPEQAFKGLYGLDPQIYRIMQNLQLAQMDMSKRQHIVLYGPPGSGKSSVFDGVRSLVSEESVLRIDATATTAAGAVKELLERRKVIPPIVQIEEIEKRGDTDLDWLLGVTDQREEIRKMNFHVNNVRKVQFLAMCTVNDMDEFKKRCKGALQSRFADKVYFPHPSREIMGMILKREITDLGEHGSVEWIEPTLEFAYDFLGLSDPREVKAICLNGRGDLVTKKYQEAFFATTNPDDYPDCRFKENGKFRTEYLDNMPAL